MTAIFFIAISLLLGLVYLPSFTARFFQDDFLLLQLAKSGNFFAPIQHFPYRPVSVQVFYSLATILFGNHPLGFHLLLFSVFLGTLYCIFKLASKLAKSKKIALLSVFFYAFNISLFPLFYWIATSYFTLGAFFLFAGLNLYLASGVMNFLFMLVFLFLGLLSNEIVIVFPLLAFLVSYYQTKYSWKKLAAIGSISGLYLLVHNHFISGPTARDYTLIYSPAIVLSTVRWYLLRIFNLPEGVRIGNNFLIYLLFFSLNLIIFSSVVLELKKKAFSLKSLYFGIAWFLAGALPFFFLPWHMSAYYLTIALFGPCLFLAKILSRHKLALGLFILTYILLAVFGLQFLSQTNWIITKPTK